MVKLKTPPVKPPWMEELKKNQEKRVHPNGAPQDKPAVPFLKPVVPKIEVKSEVPSPVVSQTKPIMQHGQTTDSNDAAGGKPMQRTLITNKDHPMPATGNSNNRFSLAESGNDFKQPLPRSGSNVGTAKCPVLRSTSAIGVNKLVPSASNGSVGSLMSKSSSSSDVSTPSHPTPNPTSPEPNKPPSSRPVASHNGSTSVKHAPSLPNTSPIRYGEANRTSNGTASNGESVQHELVSLRHRVRDLEGTVVSMQQELVQLKIMLEEERKFRLQHIRNNETAVVHL